jgi:hypothetical protein
MDDVILNKVATIERGFGLAKRASTSPCIWSGASRSASHRRADTPSTCWWTLASWTGNANRAVRHPSPRHIPIWNMPPRDPCPAGTERSIGHYVPLSIPKSLPIGHHIVLAIFGSLPIARQGPGAGSTRAARHEGVSAITPTPTWAKLSTRALGRHRSVRGRGRLPARAHDAE